MIKRVVLGVLIFACVVLLLIFVPQSSKLDYEEEDYVKGEVIVGFYDDVDEKDASALIESLNLDWPYGKFDDTFFIKLSYKPEVSAEDGWEMRNEFATEVISKDRAINDDVFIVSSSEAYSDQIIISFNEKATEESARGLIGEFEDLEILEIVYSPKFVVVLVSEGQEEEWILKLEKENIVEYVELNYLTFVG